MRLQDQTFKVSCYFYDLNFWGMINLIFITLVVLGLVFLFLQQRMNIQQEDWIRSEKKALKKLRKTNSFYFNRNLAAEKKANPQPDLKPIPKKVLPQVRNFEFPKPVKRRSKTSVISN